MRTLKKNKETIRIQEGMKSSLSIDAEDLMVYIRQDARTASFKLDKEEAIELQAWLRKTLAKLEEQSTIVEQPIYESEIAVGDHVVVKGLYKNPIAKTTAKVVKVSADIITISYYGALDRKRYRKEVPRSDIVDVWPKQKA